MIKLCPTDTIISQMSGEKPSTFIETVKLNDNCLTRLKDLSEHSIFNSY